MWWLVEGAVAAPVFDVDRGTFDAPFVLEVTPDAGGSILYSTDLSEPTVPWAGPLSVTTTTVVRACEVAPDGTRSPITTQTYVQVDDAIDAPSMDPRITQDPALRAVLEDSLRTLPLVSVVIPTGLSLTEAPGSVEWLDPAGESAQIDGGVHIVGGTSWAYAKTSIRLNFRSRYGETRWDFDVFGPDTAGLRATDSHDALTLRGGNHDSVFYLQARGQYLRNRWADETQLEMGHVAPHGRFVHAFVNGTYHGVYHVRERFSSGFLVSYYGGDEPDYEVVTGGVTEDGDGSTWARIVSSSADYGQFREWVDVPQYLDYLVLQYYAANAWDWYSWHNWMGGGPVTEGRGGWIFHGNDQDITLYYDPTTDITGLGGPGDLFFGLWAEGDPDFQVALADALHRNFEGDGPVTAANAGARYVRLADEIDEALVGESARWGGGWWDRDEEWRTERDLLVDTWFPQRTALFLDQARARGWYRPAPTFDVPAGFVERGTRLTIDGGTAAELWVTTDGSDPRLPGGAVSPSATDARTEVSLDQSTVVSARLRTGEQWGALERAFYEVDAAPAIVVNEWNAVQPGELLEEGDAALGHLEGNGGPWLELVVLQDTLDLRGFRLTTEDRWGPLGEVRFTDDPRWAALPRGTLFTVAAALPEDPAFAPEAGDWRFHVQVSPDGALAQGSLQITPLDWRVTLWDADGHVVYGPVGEGVEPRGGLGSDEVGVWKGPLGPEVRRDDDGYGASDASTFGTANTWDGEVQNLDVLRGATTGTRPPDEEPAPPASDPTSPAPTPGRPAGCGCDATAGAGAWVVLLAALALRRRAGVAAALAGCTPQVAVAPQKPEPEPEPTAPPGVCFADEDGDGWGGDPAPCGPGAVAADGDCDDRAASTNPGQPETCDGDDEDCSGAVDDDPVDGLPFFEDLDRDGFGAALVSGCVRAEGWSVVGGDCDDTVATTFPGAPEACDEVDDDCDGAVDDAAGSSSACPVSSCLDAAGADGVYWVDLAGVVSPVWCDTTTDGGGWMLGFLRNSAATGNQAGFGGAGGSASGELLPGPFEASRSTVPALGWLDLEALSFTELQVASYQDGLETTRSRPIPRADLRIPFGSDGYLLYGESGYWWCGGSAAYTDGGVGAVNNPPGAPPGCKGHGGLGSGWDFSESAGANAGLTLCGADGSNWMYGAWAAGLVSYGAPGAAQAIWVR